MLTVVAVYDVAIDADFDDAPIATVQQVAVAIANVLGTDARGFFHNKDAAKTKFHLTITWTTNANRQKGELIAEVIYYAIDRLAQVNGAYDVKFR